jgi:DNA-binding LacI/PurR family transcriptional regulator
MGAIAAIQERGLKVPHDVSVLGFDDIPFARIFQPPITTVAQPIYEMGVAAMTSILQPPPAGGARERSGHQVRLSARLVIRQSTGPCRNPPATKRKTAPKRGSKEERHDLQDHAP